MRFLPHALEYHLRGWSILPIGLWGDGKKPALPSWKEYQQRQPTPNELAEWFKQPNLAGLAAVLGPVSGGLYCRDFDDLTAYQRWASQHPEYAKRLPTVVTSRGRHVYFGSATVIRTKKFEDGELRGNGCYCLLPPSDHKSGHVYRWEIALPSDKLPEIDPQEAGFCQEWSCPETTEESRVNQCGSQVSQSSQFSLASLYSLSNLAIPTSLHQSHKLLFQLARAVKAFEKRGGRKLSQEELHAVFNEWHRKALPFLRPEQGRDEYWFEFLEGIERVKFPLGEGTLTLAWERAQKSPVPKVAEQFEQPQIRLLVALCRELQRSAGEAPFYISCRTVQSLFQLGSHTTANLWLRGLRHVKIIREVEKGGPSTNRASRYNYLHPLDE